MAKMLAETYGFLVISKNFQAIFHLCSNVRSLNSNEIYEHQNQNYTIFLNTIIAFF